MATARACPAATCSRVTINNAIEGHAAIAAPSSRAPLRRTVGAAVAPRAAAASVSTSPLSGGGIVRIAAPAAPTACRPVAPELRPAALTVEVALLDPYAFANAAWGYGEAARHACDVLSRHNDALRRYGACAEDFLAKHLPATEAMAAKMNTALEAAEALGNDPTAQLAHLLRCGSGRITGTKMAEAASAVMPPPLPFRDLGLSLPGGVDGGYEARVLSGLHKFVGVMYQPDVAESLNKANLLPRLKGHGFSTGFISAACFHAATGLQRLETALKKAVGARFGAEQNPREALLHKAARYEAARMALASAAPTVHATALAAAARVAAPLAGRFALTPLLGSMGDEAVNDEVYSSNTAQQLLEEIEFAAGSIDNNTASPVPRPDAGRVGGGGAGHIVKTAFFWEGGDEPDANSPAVVQPSGPRPGGEGEAALLEFVGAAAPQPSSAPRARGPLRFVGAAARAVGGALLGFGRRGRNGKPL